jgi:pyruvate/2-oxoglutarate dehydrogenase complex dihydrolipoamide acyltransferase (E2) component
MAVDVFLPKTGVYMDDVTLLEWRVAEGGYVEEGQPVLLMETEKVEVEVEAEASGWLHRIVEPEATLPIGTVVGVIAASETEYARLMAGDGSEGS